MKILFIGCVEFSEHAFQTLTQCENIEIVGLVTKEVSNFNSDFRNLAPLAHAIKCPVHYYTPQNSEGMEQFIRQLSPDVIYCFGWSHLLSETILTIPRLGVVGYHPAELPKNRGRHPIIWALALGLEQTASTFFIMDKGADSGDIVSQKIVDISPQDHARDLYDKLMNVSGPQIREMTAAFVDGSIQYKAQDNQFANNWRKRSKNDGRIDWRMPAQNIYNLVRALSKPYVGAHIETPSEDILVWHVDCGPQYPRHFEPGRIMDINDQRITVKCGDSSIILIDYETNQSFEIGAYL